MTISLITVDQCEMGIRSISAYLKKHGVKTRLIYLNTGDRKYTKHQIEQLIGLVRDSTLIGISFRYVSISRAIQLSQRLKELEVPVIVGGPAAISAPNLCTRYFDVVCATEGEELMLELYRKLRAGKSISQIKGIHISIDDMTIRNKRKPLSKVNLDYDYSCENDYMLRGKKVLKINRPTLFYDNYQVFVKKAVFVMSVRGCLFECNYCINSILKKYFSYRKNRISILIRQLRDIISRHPQTQYIYIFDDDFFSRTLQELRQFAVLYKKYINLPFWAYCSPITITQEKLDILVDAGLANISMGIQSGSDHINYNIYNRKIKRDDVLRASAIISRYSDRIETPLYDIMINNPYEKRDDVMQTIELLSAIPPSFYIDCHSLIFFPGSKLYERFKIEHMDRFNATCFKWNYHDLRQVNLRSRNLYLNSVLLWMEGLWSNRFLGLVPRKFIPLLTDERTIRFFSKNPKVVLLINRAMSKIRYFYQSLQKNNPEVHSFKYV